MEPDGVFPYRSRGNDREQKLWGMKADRMRQDGTRHAVPASFPHIKTYHVGEGAAM